ncbi:MAG TPA: VOC family protein [Chryseolinea sp.]
MIKINAYLTFNGNCREAMSFYRRCFGGELSFQVLGDCPGADRLPLPMRLTILQATLVNDQLTLVGSDMVGEQGLSKGNSVSLMLFCSDEEELKACYKKLISGGKIIHRPGKTYWDALFGVVQDRYGHQWLLSC